MASSVGPSLSSGLDVLHQQQLIWVFLFLPFPFITAFLFSILLVLQSFGLQASKKLVGGNISSVGRTGCVAQDSTSTVEEDVLEWVKKDKRRMLHVVYRVGDLDRTIRLRS